MEIYYDEIDTPVGTLFLASHGEKIVCIEFGRISDLKKNRIKWFQQYFKDYEFVRDPTKVEQAKQELVDYFHNKRDNFTFAFQLFGTPFQKKVWQALFDSIPIGKTKSYKEIAELIGNEKAVRAVGGSVNKNPLSIVIPCHRVIGANGQLVGYNGGLDKKSFLLNHETSNLLQIDFLPHVASNKPSTE